MGKENIIWVKRPREETFQDAIVLCRYTITSIHIICSIICLYAITSIHAVCPYILQISHLLILRAKWK